LVVITFTIPLGQQFRSTPIVKGQASSAPSKHQLNRTIIIAGLISLIIAGLLMYLAKENYFGRDFWYHNFLARQVNF
ncbi:MAG: DUF1467 family protein, partial [Pseudomonadota bacterium]